MNSAALQLLGAEVLGLAVVVLALFGLRRHIGLTPLYVTLGAFQSVQVMLSSSVYVEPVAGIPVSPGTLMFAASLLAMLLVYIREDATEARKVIYGILGANLIMTLVLYGASVQLRTPGTENLLDLPPELFSQGARVTVVGTVVLFADVLLLILGYTGAARLAPRHPLLRVWLTLTGVLVFDALAFTTGVFAERSEYPRLLAAAVLSKAAIATLFSAALILYLRYIEPQDLAGAARHHPLRDVFYSLSYRDKFELQEQETARLDRERRQVFERITDGFVALDRNWTYTYVNARAAQVFGCRPGDMVGRSIWDVFPEGARDAFEQAFQKAMAEQQPAYLEAYYPPYDRWFENHIYPSPEGLTIYFKDISERIQRQRELLERATRDELTGLPNRSAMREALDERIAEATRADVMILDAPAAQAAAPARHVGAVAINIDRLHHVNDTLGFNAGDAVLVEAAGRLQRLAAEHGCSVGRIGGDEFLLASGPARDPAPFESLARGAAQVLAQPYLIDGETIHLTCSAGVSWSPEAGSDAAQLLGQADLALNLAKQQGRNRIVTYSQERALDMAERIGITAELREALHRREFRLVYQPLVDARDGSIVGAEALLRWTSRRLGAVPPSRFIPVAEDAGMIVRLGEWALRSALAELRGWLAAGLDPVPVSVNVSVVQLQRSGFVAEVEAALHEAGVAPDLLKLEITESLFMDDADTAIAMLTRLRQLGVHVSLDDFGTGWSSLAHLRQLPIDAIKIDQGFVRDVPADSYAATLCRAIVAMSRQLHFTVVAEGVETEAQARFLHEAGCDVLQGYLFARPVDASELAALLTARSRWGLDGRRVEAG